MLLSITVAEWCYKDFQLGVTQVNKGKSKVKGKYASLVMGETTQVL